VSLQTTMLVCRHHSCSQKTQMQLWWSAAENWLSKVDPTLAFCLAQRVTTMLGTILALKVNMPLIWPGNCGFGKQASALPQTAGIAQKLSDEDIKAVTSYFETLPRE
jgi:hypothetical protein